MGGLLGLILAFKDSGEFGFLTFSDCQGYPLTAHRYPSLPIVTHRYPSLPIVTHRYPLVTHSLPTRTPLVTHLLLARYPKAAGKRPAH